MSGDGSAQFDGPGGDAASPATLDAYLDGQLAPAERSAFEARLAGDPALATNAEMQRRIDASLAGLFAVPMFPGLPTNGHPKDLPNNGPPAAPNAAPVVQKVISGMLAAAVLGVLSWLLYSIFFADPRMSFADVYEQQAKAALAAPDAPAIGSMGCGLAFKGRDPNVRVTAMTMAPVVSKNTIVFRAMVDGKPVVVFTDSSLRDDGKASRASKSSNLHLFKRQSMGVVMYEMTPFDRPRLLPDLDVVLPECSPETQPSNSQ
jgi:hypothetical protein